jgi:FixJ family two-component response regulator
VLIVRHDLLETVAGRLSQLAQRPPLILLCELGDIITRAEQTKHGVSACLVIPVEVGALAAAISEVLDREVARGQDPDHR